MWVQIKLSRGRREENRKEKEEFQWDRGMVRGRKTRNKSVSGEVLFRSVKGNKRANQVRMEGFPLVVTEPPVTLERETPFKEHREVRKWGASLS